MFNDNDWWRGATIYQIYPRSFFDSTGDGSGDLAGIAAKMDYIADLGVDAIWLSPFFTSPMKDMGYDVADYRNVDPLFGTLRDFDNVVTAAHKRGIKVIIDQVLNHTSDEHPWFVESRASRQNPKSEWYIWVDPKPDGSPPNNWLSVFGGPAWTWNSQRRQYYLHNFLSSQPDLNYYCPEVTEQILSDMEFWLQRGVDGFRLDAINHCYHDQHLRDNPAKIIQEIPLADVAGVALGTGRENPYVYQHHLYDKTRPENLTLLMKIRKLMNKYPGAATVGEIGGDGALETMASYTSGGDKLHMAYTFDLLSEQCDANFLRTTIETIEAKIHDGWMCWSFGNHDVVRLATRWSGIQAGTQRTGSGANSALAQARLHVYLALLLTLRGSVNIYQGEELGLEEAELSLEELVDPFGLAFWPMFKGRDGCRTPIPWVSEDENNAGFSTGKPWLPVFPPHRALAVNVQEKNPRSMLNAYRQFLAWRRTQKILQKGDIRFHASPDKTLLYERSFDGEHMLVALNFSEQETNVVLPSNKGITPTATELFMVNARWDNPNVELPPYGIGLAWRQR